MFKIKSEFSRNVLTLMTGTTIAQAIPIAISPILTRMYSPENFGVFAIYTAIFSILAVFATAKYELAIILPKKDTDAANIVFLSILISLFISFFLLIIIFIFNLELTLLLRNKEISQWLYFIPLSVFLVGLYQSFNYWSNRKKNYGIISKSIVLQSSSNATGNISFGMSGLSTSGLVITNIVTSILSSFYLMLKNRKDISEYKDYINKLKILALIKKYKKFPQHTLPQNILYHCTLQMPIFFIKVFFSLSVLGSFFLAYRIIAMPVSIISNSVGQVFYQKASVLYPQSLDELYLYTKKMFVNLLILSTLIGSSIIYFLPDMFDLIFGSKWREAGEIAQFLMIYLVFNFALSPLTKLYFIANQNSLYLKWEALRFVLFLLFFFSFYFIDISDVDYFFLVFSLINLLMYIIIAIPILNQKSFLWKL